MAGVKVVGQVTFACNQCGTSALALVGAVKTIDEKTYIMCQCENNHTVPLNLDHVVMKLYEISPPKVTN